MWVGAETSGDEHAEPGFGVTGFVRARRGDHADVVEHRLTAVGLATGEVDLELAGETLTERVAHEVTERGLGPRADVEHLVRARAGEMAALDVADGVAARFPRREPDRRQVTHHLGDLGQRDEVELDVLAGRDVAPPARVLVDEPADHLELLGLDRSVGHLHPDHLVLAALTLAVDAVAQAEHPEDVLVEIAREVAHEHLLELLDVHQLLGVDRPRPNGGRSGSAHSDGKSVGHRAIMTHLVGIYHLHAPGSSPISFRASFNAARKRRATVGERWATRPVPGRPTSSTVSTTRGSASS